MKTHPTQTNADTPVALMVSLYVCVRVSMSSCKLASSKLAAHDWQAKVNDGIRFGALIGVIGPQGSVSLRHTR